MNWKEGIRRSAAGYGFGIDFPAAVIERVVRGKDASGKPYTFGNQYFDKTFDDINGYRKGPEFYAGCLVGFSIPFTWILFGLSDAYNIFKKSNRIRE